MIVAIDGPAGSGKGTLAKMVADKLNFQYVDTGAMYRCVALKMLEQNIKMEDTDKIKEILKNIKIDLEGTKVFLNGQDVSKEIRTVEVANFVSPVSTIDFIREKMVDWQRELAKDKDIVMEGRDIGTVVFPNADVKIYLDASPEVRANRRVRQNKENGIESSYEQILKDIMERDTRDMSRAISPLKKADDAIVVDTSDTDDCNINAERLVKVIQDNYKR